MRANSFRAALIAAIAVFSLSTPAQSLEPRIQIDKPAILEGEAASVYVLARFHAPDDPKAAVDRPPLNLAMVLDRSGSMADKGKIAYLKKAAGMMVDALQPRDRLAVVEYDDRITVLWPSAPVEAPGMVKGLIEELAPRGSTNLAGGMMRGADEIAPHAGRDVLTRVLLLSDGLANEGVTDPYEIRRLTRKARERGVRVSTLGLGLDYNEDLMQDIAETSGGNYYFIEGSSQIAGIFARELKTLFRTIARDPALEFEATDAVRDAQVFGREADKDAKGVDVALEDFYAGESRSVLMRLDVGPKKPGKLALGELRFTYLDAKGSERKRFSAPIEILVTADKAEVEEAANREVQIEVALVEAEREHEESVRLFQKGEHDAARKRMRAMADSLSKRNAALNDARLAAKIEAFDVEQEQMTDALAAPEAAGMMQSYIKSSKQRLYQASKGARSLYMLQEGDKGPEVENLQKALASGGHYKGPIDGVFSPDVGAALRAFQGENDMDVDGVAGPATLRELKLY